MILLTNIPDFIIVSSLQQDPFDTASSVSDADLERYKQQKILTLRDLLDIAKNASVILMFDVREPVDSNPFKLNTTGLIIESLNQSGIDMEKVCEGGYTAANPSGFPGIFLISTWSP